MLDALWSMKELCSTAKSLGMQALALTDYYGVYGAIDFYQEAKKSDILPLFGMEVGYVDDISTTLSATQVGTICLLAKNHEGYQALLTLASQAHENLMLDAPTIDASILKDHTAHLIGYVGSPSSVLGHMVGQGLRIEDITMTLNNMNFGSGDLYLEMMAQPYTNYPLLQKIHAMIPDICANMKMDVHKQCFASSPVHYVHPDDKKAFELAMAIKDGKKMYDKDKRTTAGLLHMMSWEEIENIYRQNDIALDTIQAWYNTTTSIVERCSVSLDLYQSLFPAYETPADLQDLYDKHKDSLIDAQEW